MSEQPRVLVDGVPIFWRSARVPAAEPVLYVHGVPGSSQDWLSFLAEAGGIALDLPGFGRSAKPSEHDHSIEGIGRAVEGFLDAIGLERTVLVLHAWGAAALSFAQRRPERVARLVLVNPLPLFGEYRWHSVARWWRQPVVGELMMVTTGRRLLGARLSAANPSLPPEFVEHLTAHFDRGTKQAILRLYRSGDPSTLQQAQAGLGRLQMPALVVWGDRDPYAAPRYADAYAAALPQAELVHLPDAGHWPWLDRSELVQRISRFAQGRPPVEG